MTADGRIKDSKGITVKTIESTAKGLKYSKIDYHLPTLYQSGVLRQPIRTLFVKGLAPGKYILKIDGDKAVFFGYGFGSNGEEIHGSTLFVVQSWHRHSAEQWAKGKQIQYGPEYQQLQKLRHAIVEKNLLYFYSWRPQNVTYLFLFRKHEQGQNAKEIEELRKLVAEKEKEIARLKKPVTHTYELIRVKEKKN